MIDQSQRCILYVDDTVEQRYAMRRILETEGFRVIEAGTGREALERVEDTVALAVVDVRLPDIDGYELSRRLKASHPHLPILQVSASFSDPKLRASGLSGGADAYIAQPVHPAELISLVQRLLLASQAEESLRFLASLGPKLSSSLSIEDTVENLRRAVVPIFANTCVVTLDALRDREALISDHEFDVPATTLQKLQDPKLPSSATLLDSQNIVVALCRAGTRIGAVTFGLSGSREYSSVDLPMATDIASRASLALQNCMLFESEQSTRAALIQSEKLATAGRMSAAIAHEINNPLEALTNLIYIIEQSDDVPEAMRDIATAALAEVSRLAHIARQSLGFYRELKTPSKLDLSESVRDTVSLYQKRMDASGIHLEINADAPLFVEAIRGEVRQVISNLLVNAIEATPSGGTVRVQTKSNGTMAELSVKDLGSGVDEAIRLQIFEPFFTTKRGTGTGLGLWITKSIVEKHGGSISLETRTGADSGSEFKVHFPLLAAS